jgi:hypothetical protein
MGLIASGGPPSMGSIARYRPLCGTGSSSPGRNGFTIGKTREGAVLGERAVHGVLLQCISLRVGLYLLGPTARPEYDRLPLGLGSPIFVGATIDLRYRIYRSKVDTLKELKQVQLQILELQASLQKRNCE